MPMPAQRSELQQQQGAALHETQQLRDTEHPLGISSCSAPRALGRLRLSPQLLLKSQSSSAHLGSRTQLQPLYFSYAELSTHGHCPALRAEPTCSCLTSHLQDQPHLGTAPQSSAHTSRTKHSCAAGMVTKILSEHLGTTYGCSFLSQCWTGDALHVAQHSSERGAADHQHTARGLDAGAQLCAVLGSAHTKHTIPCRVLLRW